MRIVVARHGATREGAKGRLLAQADHALTPRGVEQSRQLADALADHAFQAIYTSDLTHCADTAKTIAKEHPDTPFSYDDRLREIDYGDLAGTTPADADWDAELLGETLEEFYKRVNSALREVAQLHTDTVLLVTHTSVIRAIIRHVLAESPGEQERVLDTVSFAPASLSEFEIGPQRRIVKLNETQHLS